MTGDFSRRAVSTVATKPTPTIAPVTTGFQHMPAIPTA
jgi:hypothetical protein